MSSCCAKQSVSGDNSSQEKESKVIAISGGATGIGRATVMLFLQEGYKVSFGDINEQASLELLSELKDLGFGQDKVLFTKVDTTNKEDIAAWSKGTMEHFGRLDAIFANAGIHRSNTMLNIDPQELKLMIDTNIYGTVFTLQEFVPYLQQNGGGSVVINCSDQFFIGKGNNFGYGLTKGALGQITRSLAVDLAKDHIRVNAVCPGTIRTPLADEALGRYANRAGISLEQAWAEEDSLFTLGRCGTSEEVAQMVYFLTEKATFSTGGHYLVDGGIVAS